MCAPFSQTTSPFRGVNGLAHLDADGKNAQGKGIWVPKGKNTFVENIEFSGATVPDQNGAGIRQDGMGLTVRNCYFHDNENGILESNVPGSNIVIEFSEFARNGFGDGQSHNLYIGHAASLLFRFNYSHDAKEGHLLKTRAAVNYILYNRLTEESGTGSYETDVPNGGTTYFIGNLIQQGQSTHNSTIFTYLEEGVHSRNPGKDLYVINNTFVNQRSAGRFINISSQDPTPAVVKNNILFGPGTLINQSSAVLANNLTVDPLFEDLANFDYHLTSHSPAINAGADPGLSSDRHLLTPLFQYVHMACGEERATVQTIDIGAYEWAGRRSAPCVLDTGGRAERALDAPPVPVVP
jgi:parallel beta helix pectate lyase-like protein